MSEMKCPYSHLELMAAVLTISEDFTEKNNDEIVSRMNALVGNKEATLEARNHEAAKVHGISVDTLINSPNYDKLMEEFEWDLVNRGIKVLEELGLDNKQAWGFMLYGIMKIGIN